MQNKCCINAMATQRFCQRQHAVDFAVPVQNLIEERAAGGQVLVTLIDNQQQLCIRPTGFYGPDGGRI
jgi:hypothetical protein